MPSNKEITSVHILKYYDCNNHLNLQIVPNLKGLVAVLFQGGYPVYYASKSLQPCQKAYIAN